MPGTHQRNPIKAMNFDQYEDQKPEQAQLAMAVSMLVSALYDRNGQPIDIADKKGREALLKAVNSVPESIPTNLSEEDRKLLRETKKALKQWFWWMMAAMFVASSVISVGVVMLLR